MQLTNDLCDALRKARIPVQRLDTGRVGYIVNVGSEGFPVFAEALDTKGIGTVLNAGQLKIRELPPDLRTSQLRNELNPYRQADMESATLWNRGFDECLLDLPSAITAGPYAEGFAFATGLLANWNTPL